MIDCTDLIPLKTHAGLVWLGKVPKWVSFDPVCEKDSLTSGVIDRSLPRTYLTVKEEALVTNMHDAESRWVVRTLTAMWKSRHFAALCYMEAASRFLADGPKLFCPNDEQFESMEHVELRMAIREFRTPYPAIAIRIPLGARKRLAAQFNVNMDRMPLSVLVRFVADPGQVPFLLVVSRFGPMNELYHMMSDQDGNPTIEDAIVRKILPDTSSGDNLPTEFPGDFPCSVLIARAALNLCLMLTHYGHKLTGPVDPAAYKKHRTKKHLEHFKHGDYLAVQMKQEITIRRPATPADNPQGPGTGLEMKPHWRRGHWRCYPGQREKRLAGENVPLLFVRPCLVRPDRVTGDLSESEAVYHGG